MNEQPIKFKYELEEGAIQFLLEVLNKVTIVGINNCKNVLSITELLQNPLNADDLDKVKYEALKAKFDIPTK